MGRRRSRPAGSRPAGTRRRPPAPRRSRRSRRPRRSAARATASAAASPQRARMLGSENHITLQKPPLRPLGPRPQAVGLEQDDARLGLQLLRVPGGPQPGVAAADDDDVGLALAARAAAPARPPGLLHPVAVCGVCSIASADCRLPARPAMSNRGRRRLDPMPDDGQRLDSLRRRAARLRGARPRPLPGPRPQGRRRRRPGDASSWSARPACATTSPRSPRASTSAPNRRRSSRPSCSPPRPGAPAAPGS